MAAEIQEKFNMDSQLVELSGGVFEVYLNEELVYSKKELDRFPNDGEVADLLSQKVS